MMASSSLSSHSAISSDRSAASPVAKRIGTRRRRGRRRGGPTVKGVPRKAAHKACVICEAAAQWPLPPSSGISDEFQKGGCPCLEAHPRGDPGSGGVKTGFLPATARVPRRATDGHELKAEDGAKAAADRHPNSTSGPAPPMPADPEIRARQRSHDHGFDQPAESKSLANFET